jgi:hypothetical protein
MRTVMIYISLPVHTQPAVVAAQLHNFAAFLPQAVVVLHVSAEARFTLPELRAALRRARCSNMVLNPTRGSTGWGRILEAHLANVAFIRGLGDARRVCLHASNDMLVRPGLSAWLARAGNLFHQRPIAPGSYWRFADAALADPALRTLCRRLGGAPLNGSQVEGASYQADWIFEIAALLAGAVGQRPPRPYPREEVWLSTVAEALGAPRTATPYVFSEIHRFDRVHWRWRRRLAPLLDGEGGARALLRRVLEHVLIRSGFHRIDRCWVDRVAQDRSELLAPYEWLSDGNNVWRVHEPHGLFGVKRVPRRVDAPLRSYIDALAAAHRGALPPPPPLAR